MNVEDWSSSIVHENIIEFEIHSTKVFAIIVQPYLLLAYPHIFCCA